MWRLRVYRYPGPNWTFRARVGIQISAAGGFAILTGVEEVGGMDERCLIGTDSRGENLGERVEIAAGNYRGRARGQDLFMGG